MADIPRGRVPDLTEEYQSRNGTVKPTMSNRNLSLSFDAEQAKLTIDLLTDSERKAMEAVSNVRIQAYKEEKESQRAHLADLMKQRLDSSGKTAEALLKLDAEILASKTRLVDLQTKISKEEQISQEKLDRAKEVAAKNLYARLSGLDKIEYQKKMAMAAKQEVEELTLQKKATDAAIVQNEEALKEKEESILQHEKIVSSIRRRISYARKKGKDTTELETDLEEAIAHKKSVEKDLEELKKYDQNLKTISENLPKGIEEARNRQTTAEEQRKKLEEYSYAGKIGGRKERLEARNKEIIEENAKISQNISIDANLVKELEQKEKEGLLTDEEKETLEGLKKNISENEKQLKANNKELSKNTIQLKTGEVLQKIADMASAKINEGINKVDSTLSSLYKDSAKYNARLYGAITGKNNGPDTAGFLRQQYNDILDTIKKSVGINPFVSVQNVISNVQKLIDMGVAQNVELRAYLATISDQIASTFSALDATLLRLERIQQADSTAVRLGMEAALNEFFNRNFQDSTFMNDAHDIVFEAIYDANSLMTREESTEFEYILQKWLGSLYSLGMSKEGISEIAKGINYLGTGDYESLASNEKLQNVLAMSASRAGLNYADILQKGIDASSLNTLMESMVSYLRDIAQNTIDNKVVASAFSHVFGMNVSDMSSILNLSNQDIKNITDSTLTYEEMGQNLINAASRVKSNTHISQYTSNLFDNIFIEAATGIGNSLAQYITWRATSLLMDLGIDVALPFINVWGFGVDLHTSVMQLVKIGQIGIELLGDLLSGAQNATTDMFTKGEGSIEKLYSVWNATQITDRGNTREDILKGRQTYTSYSISIQAPFATNYGNGLDVGSERFGGNTQDIENEAITQGVEKAKEQDEVIGGHEETPEHDLDDLYNALFTYHFPVYTMDMIAMAKAVGVGVSKKINNSYDIDTESTTQWSTPATQNLSSSFFSYSPLFPNSIMWSNKSEPTTQSLIFQTMMGKMFELPELAGEDGKNNVEAYSDTLQDFYDITNDIVQMSMDSDNMVSIKQFEQPAKDTISQILALYLKQLLQSIGADKLQQSSSSVSIGSQEPGTMQAPKTLVEMLLRGATSSSGINDTDPVQQILSILQNSVNVNVVSMSPEAQTAFV